MSNSITHSTCSPDVDKSPPSRPRSIDTVPDELPPPYKSTISTTPIPVFSEEFYILWSSLIMALNGIDGMRTWTKYALIRYHRSKATKIRPRSEAKALEYLKAPLRMATGFWRSGLKKAIMRKVEAGEECIYHERSQCYCSSWKVCQGTEKGLLNFKGWYEEERVEFYYKYT